jgi:hypothetical protein
MSQRGSLAAVASQHRHELIRDRECRFPTELTTNASTPQRAYVAWRHRAELTNTPTSCPSALHVDTCAASTSAPVVGRGRLGTPSRFHDLGRLHSPEPRQDLPPEQLQVVTRARIGFVPTPTAPEVGDDGTRLAWPLHEPTELPVGGARQGTEQRPCTRVGRWNAAPYSALGADRLPRP